MAFKNGAGSIRAYPHAENTGLVISDGAEIQTFSEIFKFFSTFMTKGLNISSTIVDQENRPCDSQKYKTYAMKDSKNSQSLVQK